MQDSLIDLLLDPSKIGPWIENYLVSRGAASGLVGFGADIVGALIVLITVLTSAIFLIWLERKVAARLQDRIGPNRAGPYGLLQTFADIVKLLTKEDITPDGADRISYNIAPALAVFQIIMVAAVIPIGPLIVGADINVGLLYFVAISGIAAMGALMAGWASNNKYALLGGFRVVAQLLSYEIPLILSMLAVVVVANTMSLNELSRVQSEPIFGFIPNWYVISMPLAFVIFLVASLAEGERAPFDLLEAESEIVAGFNIEYSGMKFAWFFLQFFVNTLLLSAIAATIFLGGWSGPFVDQVPALGIVYFAIKTTIVVFVMMWIRATFPRLRIDQMMAFCWKVLVPLALIAVGLSAFVVKLPLSDDLKPLIMGASSVVILLVALGIIGRSLRKSNINRKSVIVTGS